MTASQVQLAELQGLCVARQAAFALPSAQAVALVRNQGTHDRREELMAKRETPDLPEEFDFCPATRRWFETWRSSRVTDHWDDRQWQYMFDTAIVHSLVWGSFDFHWLSELRTRETQMGLVYDD